jgi:co-chaperonin GroES (HSP10)
MTQHSAGDKLARGDKSAQFSAQAGLSDFENDLIFHPETVAKKYGITQGLVERYQKLRTQGEKMPDLPTKAVVEEEKQDKADALRLGYTVVDKRIGVMPQAAVVEATPLKYPTKEYTAFKPVLDRVLVKRTTIDPNMEELSDGSLRDKRTGFITPATYREHQNVGHVLSVGDFVVMGGVKTRLEDIVKPGDRVTWGDYNSEVFMMSDDKVEALCDKLKINYVSDPEGLRIVRVQDIRGVESPIDEENSEEYAGDDSWGV